MHRDGKERRQIIKAMVQRQTRISKYPDQLRYGKEKKDAE